jgi:hypothetical protein
MTSIIVEEINQEECLEPSFKQLPPFVPIVDEVLEQRWQNWTRYSNRTKKDCEMKNAIMIILQGSEAVARYSSGEVSARNTSASSYRTDALFALRECFRVTKRDGHLVMAHFANDWSGMLLHLTPQHLQDMYQLAGSSLMRTLGLGSIGKTVIKLAENYGLIKRYYGRSTRELYVEWDDARWACLEEKAKKAYDLRCQNWRRFIRQRRNS